MSHQRDEHRAAAPDSPSMTFYLQPRTEYTDLQGHQPAAILGLHTSTKINGSKAQAMYGETARLDLELQSSQTAMKRQGLVMPCTWRDNALRTDIHVEAHVDSLRIPESYSVSSKGSVEIFSTSDFPNSAELWNQQGSSLPAYHRSSSYIQDQGHW